MRTHVGLTAKLIKLIRYLKLYGPERTLVKLIGRNRKLAWLRLPVFGRTLPGVGVIGCGQFAFSTLCYYLQKQWGNVLVGCYDPDVQNAETLAAFYGIPSVRSEAAEVIHDPAVQTVIIASNHASHAAYAIDALKQKKDVYLEKPVAVSFEQFRPLMAAVHQAQSKVYAGYNRPFSPAVTVLKRHLKNNAGPMSINCFVVGHHIPPGHWYRKPEEGTRICGNVGHWLDLAIHLLSLNNACPDEFQISLAYSNLDEPDDNLAITLTTDRGDLVNIVLSAREEPLEGIHETICIQQDDLICQIDDFRRLELWQATRHLRKVFWPKAVGHPEALQQLSGRFSRDWREVELSTLLMLHISKMVRNREEKSIFPLKRTWENLMVEIRQETAIVPS